MKFGFDTNDDAAATAALLVYAIWRSRDWKRFKVTPDLWGQVERFTKDAAKRATRLTQFVEALKPRLACPSIKPRWMAVGMAGEVPLQAVHDASGRLSYAIQYSADADQRKFMTRIFETADHKSALRRAYEETSWVILLVRDRLEREKPLENRIQEIEEEIND